VDVSGDPRMGAARQSRPVDVDCERTTIRTARDPGSRKRGGPGEILAQDARFGAVDRVEELHGAIRVLYGSLVQVERVERPRFHGGTRA